MVKIGAVYMLLLVRNVKICCLLTCSCMYICPVSLQWSCVLHHSNMMLVVEKTSDKKHFHNLAAPSRCMNEM